MNDILLTAGRHFFLRRELAVTAIFSVAVLILYHVVRSDCDSRCWFAVRQGTSVIWRHVYVYGGAICHQRVQWNQLQYVYLLFVLFFPRVFLFSFYVSICVWACVAFNLRDPTMICHANNVTHIYKRGAVDRPKCKCLVESQREWGGTNL